jgi:hypothetical protein
MHSSFLWRNYGKFRREATHPIKPLEGSSENYLLKTSGYETDKFAGILIAELVHMPADHQDGNWINV